MIKRLLILLMLPVAFAQTTERSVADFIRDGNLYLLQGQCPLAQYVFQEALKQEESNIEAMIGKGKALSCQNAYDLGIAEFEKALELDAQNVTAHVQLALAYQDQQFSNPDQYPNGLSNALATIERAEQLDAESAQVHNTKGIILYQLGNYTGARSALERAVSLAGNSDFSQQDLSRIQVNLGKAYQQLDEMDLAQQAFRRAVTLDPTNASAHNNLGFIYFELERCEDAEFELTQAANLNPRSLDAVSNLAVALFECGKVESALPRLEQALDIPNALSIPALYTYLSRAYAAQGRFDDAVREAQKGALLPPEDAEAHYYVGQAYEGRNGPGDIDQARRSYQRALEINPEFTPAQQALDALP